MCQKASLVSAKIVKLSRKLRVYHVAFNSSNNDVMQTELTHNKQVSVSNGRKRSFILSLSSDYVSAKTVTT
jgi:hypothetical protein